MNIKKIIIHLKQDIPILILHLSYFSLPSYCSENGEMCAMKEVTLCSDDAKSKESAQQLKQVSSATVSWNTIF